VNRENESFLKKEKHPGNVFQVSLKIIPGCGCGLELGLDELATASILVEKFTDSSNASAAGSQGDGDIIFIGADSFGDDSDVAFVWNTLGLLFLLKYSYDHAFHKDHPP